MQSVTLYLNKTDELLPQQSQFRLLHLVKLACIKAVSELACGDVFPEHVRLEFCGDCRVTPSSARGCGEGVSLCRLPQPWRNKQSESGYCVLIIAASSWEAICLTYGITWCLTMACIRKKKQLWPWITELMRAPQGENPRTGVKDSLWRMCFSLHFILIKHC